MESNRLYFWVVLEKAPLVAFYVDQGAHGAILYIDKIEAFASFADHEWKLLYVEKGSCH